MRLHILEGVLRVELLRRHCAPIEIVSPVEIWRKHFLGKGPFCIHYDIVLSCGSDHRRHREYFGLMTFLLWLLFGGSSSCDETKQAY